MQYNIIRAGTAAAYNKNPPEKIFNINSKGGNYVDFKERRKKLLQKQRKEKEKEEKEEVKVEWK